MLCMFNDNVLEQDHVLIVIWGARKYYKGINYSAINTHSIYESKHESNISNFLVALLVRTCGSRCDYYKKVNCLENPYRIYGRP